MLGKLSGVVATGALAATALALAAWFGFAALTGATLITFRTGSMAPTMPQGALAVTLPVSAADLAVDDVITVQRVDDKLPVTHRITSIKPAVAPAPNSADFRAAAPGATTMPVPGAAGTFEITMQGDDNKTPDSLPYVISDARKVVAAAPQLGAALMVMQSQAGFGLILIAFGTLATWAFWPRSAARTHPSPSSSPARCTHALGQARHRYIAEEAS